MTWYHSRFEKYISNVQSDYLSISAIDIKKGETLDYLAAPKPTIETRKIFISFLANKRLNNFSNTNPSRRRDPFFTWILLIFSFSTELMLRPFRNTAQSRPSASTSYKQSILWFWITIFFSFFLSFRSFGSACCSSFICLFISIVDLKPEACLLVCTSSHPSFRSLLVVQELACFGLLIVHSKRTFLVATERITKGTLAFSSSSSNKDLDSPRNRSERERSLNPLSFLSPLLLCKLDSQFFIALPTSSVSSITANSPTVMTDNLYPKNLTAIIVKLNGNN